MAIPGYNEPFPSRDTIVKRSRKAEDVFLRWNEQSLLARVQATPARVQSAEVLTAQNASTSGTFGGSLSAGLYRVSTYMQVTTPAGVASSVQITLGWTHNAVAQSEILAVMNGNTIVTHQGLSSIMEIDAGTTISYTITYASNPAGIMVYDASLMAELLQPIG